MKLNEIDLSKTLAVTHCDFDGESPIILNKFFNIEYAKSISCNYSEDLELESLRSGSFENVVYTDFTPSESCRKAIIENNIKCLIIDHHESVKEEIEEFCKSYYNVEYIYDINKCGTKLYYEWLKEQGYIGNNVCEHLVELTNTYDLYKKDSPLWKEAENCNRLLYSSGKYYYKDDRLKCFETFINSMVWKLQNMNEFKFVAWEMEKIQGDINKENELFESIIRNASKEISTRKDSKGHYFIVYTCKSKISAIASRILDKYKKVDYCIILNDYNPNDIKISLRSRDNFDLLSLCGTSGHSNACGINADSVGDVTKFANDLKNKVIFELGYKEN